MSCRRQGRVFGYLFDICEVVTEGRERICRVIRSMTIFIFSSKLRLRNPPPSIQSRHIRGPFLKVAIASSAVERIRSLLLWE